MKYTLLLCFVATLFSQSIAQASYEYPELLVTPKASERLKMEVVSEKKTGVFVHKPILVSGMMTFMAGVAQFGGLEKKDDEREISPYAGLAVGGFWMGLTTYLGGSYRPYLREYRRIAKLPAKTKREQLLKERLAEESIEKMGRVGRRMVWFSTLTNLGANIYMLSKTEKNNIAPVMSGLAVAASLGPLIFSNNWTETAKKHKEYKKKIYAPIASATMLYNPFKKKYVPGMMLGMSF